MDRLLDRKQDAFVDYLDLQAVKDAAYGCEPIILSGICMKEVLARIGNPYAVHVYVKRMHLGYWTHQVEAEGRGSELDENFPPCVLEREVRAYHDTFKPHEKASYVYERTVNGAGL